MNLYAPFERQQSGRWDYCCSNKRRGTYAIGYCMGWPYDRPTSPEIVQLLGSVHYARLRAEAEPHRAKYHTDGHATPADAIECYRQFLLDCDLHLNGEVGEWSPCVECERIYRASTNLPDDAKLHPQTAHAMLTNQCARIGSLAYFSLCDAHRTRAIVAQHFTLSRTIWSSY